MDDERYERGMEKLREINEPHSEMMDVAYEEEDNVDSSFSVNVTLYNVYVRRRDGFRAMQVVDSLFGDESDSEYDDYDDYDDEEMDDDDPDS